MASPPTPTPPIPTCTIAVYERGLYGSTVLNQLGITHAYIVLASSTNPTRPEIFEGQQDTNGNLVANGAIFTGQPGGYLQDDKPVTDVYEGSSIGSMICSWFAILQNDVARVNSAPAIPYSAFLGPNSNSVLAYFLSTLPDRTWYLNPFLWGFGDCLPAVNCPRPLNPSPIGPVRGPRPPISGPVNPRPRR